MTLEDYLRDNSVKFADAVAVQHGDECLTYRELFARASERAAEFAAGEARAAELKGGRAVVFRASQSIDFLIDYIAIHLAGRVAVPLERDTPEESFRQIQTTVAGAEIPEEVADILFTTGTTGKQKGVMISHRTIVADAENLIAAQKYSHDLTFIITGPLNHIGSLSKIYPTLILGAKLHILDNMKNLNDFYAVIEASPNKVATFLVPATIRMILSLSADRLAAVKDKIDFIETGAAPISAADMEALCRILPGSRLYNTYASTETGIIATFNFNEGFCTAGCLGRPMINSTIEVEPDGRITCGGDTLMTGYVADSEHTASVLYDGKLHTSDIGYLDEEGRLRLTGRNDDVINVGGFKVAPTEVENAALAIPGINDCICIPVAHPILGHGLKLLVVEDQPGTLTKRAIALQLASTLESYKVPTAYEFVSTIARTYNGKLDRKFYL